MRSYRPFLVLAVVASFFAVPSSAWAAKKNKGGGAFGVIEQVSDGTLVVKMTGKKKKGAPAAEGTTKKFTLTKDTKIEMLVGKKKDKTTQPATVVDLKVGERVMVTAAGDKAENVKILGGKKKKKKNT